MIKASAILGLIILGMLSSGDGRAQQQPMFTQYMFNGLVLNPAYAGSQGAFTATAVMRRQWVGIADAPQTQTLSAHSPLDGLRTGRRPGSPVSVGITAYNDRMAITGQSGLLAAYAYRIEFKNGSTFSMGLQAGIRQLRIRYSELGLDDPAFAVGDISDWQPEFGTGVYYQTPRFYTGLSAPQMLRKSIYPEGSALTLAPHYFLTMGYVFDAGHTVKIKPNVLVKQYSEDVLQVDVNCNVFLNEILNLGVSWRSFESVSALFQLHLQERLAVGYAYDIPCGRGFSTFSSGSHEIMLRYTRPSKKIRTINPRFF